MPEETEARRPEAKPAPAGFVRVAVPAGDDWRVELGRRCRANATRNRPACGEPSVAALNRGLHRHPLGRIDAWWAYCAEHMYGKWVEDGQVMQWVLRPVEEVPDVR